MMYVGTDVLTPYREKIKYEHRQKFVMNIKWNIEKHSINCIGTKHNWQKSEKRLVK